MPLVFGRPRQGKSADLDKKVGRPRQRKIVDIGILGSAPCPKPRHQAGLTWAGRLITSVGDGGSLRLGKVQRKQTRSSMSYSNVRPMDAQYFCLLRPRPIVLGGANVPVTLSALPTQLASGCPP
jgi:hypothetical protein